jgi:hypothetical protein
MPPRRGPDQSLFLELIEGLGHAAPASGREIRGSATVRGRFGPAHQQPTGQAFLDLVAGIGRGGECARGTPMCRAAGSISLTMRASLNVLNAMDCGAHYLAYANKRTQIMRAAINLI